MLHRATIRVPPAARQTLVRRNSLSEGISQGIFLFFARGIALAMCNLTDASVARCMCAVNRPYTNHMRIRTSFCSRWHSLSVDKIATTYSYNSRSSLVVFLSFSRHPLVVCPSPRSDPAADDAALRTGFYAVHALRMNRSRPMQSVVACAIQLPALATEQGMSLQINSFSTAINLSSRPSRGRP
jgi:hypothetical protein